MGFRLAREGVAVGVAAAVAAVGAVAAVAAVAAVGMIRNSIRIAS
ncbi:MAG: hypothetical protein OXF11_10385 [Deltaproteobacteria bacterium]|nr:hypothetical protein [Deltaproteobacteria bacterium]